MAKREWERARSLRSLDALDAIALWRSGPAPLDLLAWRHIVDVRHEQRSRSALDQAFPELMVIIAATTRDGEEVRTQDPVPRTAVRQVIEDKEQRFDPTSITVHVAPPSEAIVKHRWLALHSFDDAVTRERIERLGTIESLRLVDFRHVPIITADRARRPADDGEFGQLIAEAFQRLATEAEEFNPDVLLTNSASSPSGPRHGFSLSSTGLRHHIRNSACSSSLRRPNPCERITLRIGRPTSPSPRRQSATSSSSTR